MHVMAADLFQHRCTTRKLKRERGERVPRSPGQLVAAGSIVSKDPKVLILDLKWFDVPNSILRRGGGVSVSESG